MTMLPHAEFYIICHSDKFVGTAMLRQICGDRDVPTKIVGTAVPTILSEQRCSDVPRKVVGTAVYGGFIQEQLLLQRLWEHQIEVSHWLFPQICRNGILCFYLSPPPPR